MKWFCSMTGNSKDVSNPGKFDYFANRYDQDLMRGVGLSGEQACFFIEQRILNLRNRLQKFGNIRVNREACKVIDYGCGHGQSTHVLRRVFSASEVIGLDVSKASLAKARANGPDEYCRFDLIDDALDINQEADLIYTNGVFHHIEPCWQTRYAKKIYQMTSNGGVFALFENNPYSLAARIVMKRIPFDRDAHLVWPAKARQVFREVGFTVLGTWYYFVFPKFLGALRPLESLIRRVPLGAQYLVIGQRR